MISVICACNNKDLFNKMLLPSLEKQSFKDYEIILIDAKEKGFVGAAQTLNYGASMSKGDILVFMHQDVELLEETAFEKINKYCVSNDFGIAGVAGVSLKDKCVYSSVLHGKKRSQSGVETKNIIQVDALDECLFIIKKNKFKGFIDYGSWHFYAVEYSLRCFRNSEKVVVLPLSVYHLSPGYSLDNSYYETLKHISKNFSELKYIPTTIKIFNNRFLFLRIQIFYMKFRKKLKWILKHEK